MVVAWQFFEKETRCSKVGVGPLLPHGVRTSFDRNDPTVETFLLYGEQTRSTSTKSFDSWWQSCVLHDHVHAFVYRLLN